MAKDIPSRLGLVDSFISYEWFVVDCGGVDTFSCRSKRDDAVSGKDAGLADLWSLRSSLFAAT